MRRFGLKTYCLGLALPLVLSMSGLPLTAQAAELAGVSKLSEVMVFPNGAEVSRSFSLDLPEGEHALILNDLPADLDPHSLRIEGAGPQGVVIGSIDHKVTTLSLDDERQSQMTGQLKDQLQILRDQRALLEAEVQAYQLQVKLLNEMALLPSRPNRQGEEGGGDLTQQYTSLYTMMGEKFIEAQKNVLDARVKIRDLDKQIRNINDRLGEQPSGNKRVSQLTVHVVAEMAGSASFTVRYQVNSAGWRPRYEARLDTENSSLQLVRRAVIFQRSQEEWDNVKITLSTANPTGRTSAPLLRPWLVDYLPDRKNDRVSGGILSMEAADEAPKGKRYSGRMLSKVAKAPAPAIARQARVNFGAYQMTFEVPGRVSVERGGAEKKVLLDKIDTKPSISLLTVPKKDRKAYLQAEFENKTENALLSGHLSLFRDGVYVGDSRLRAIEPGQNAKIGFGVDPNVNVKFTKLDRVKGETGLITSSNSDVHRYKILVTNGHKKAMKVTVLDQLPYAQEETLSITMLETNPKPSRTDVDDKRGVLAWDFDLKAGASKEIQFGYQLVWPKDKRITLR